MYETKYLYSIHKGQFLDKQDFFVEFERKPFDISGTFRNCHKGKILDRNRNVVTTEDFKTGKCVVKIPKNGTGTYNYKLDFICSEEAISLAKKYNNEVAKIPDKLNFLLPYGARLDYGDNKIVSVEPFLEGEYIKFYNNDGEPYNRYKSLTAFCHYTWIINKGRKVITDIQGIKLNNKFYLTDPACQSLEMKYGESDLGVQGLIKFLLYHKCNDICREWKWIDINSYFKLTKNEKASIKNSKYKFQSIINDKYNKYLEIYQKCLELIGY